MCRHFRYFLCLCLCSTHLVLCNPFFGKSPPTFLDNVHPAVQNPQIQQVVPETGANTADDTNQPQHRNTSDAPDQNLSKPEAENSPNPNESQPNSQQNNPAEGLTENNGAGQEENASATNGSTEDENPDENENDLMYYLTQYRNRARRTVDGYLCAAAFVQRDQIYTDCTVEVAPDGTEGREWCYLEAQITGKVERDWGFCETPLNYEEIRAATLNHIVQKVSQADEMLKSLNTYRKLIKESERRLV